jgi:hypothetical protein
MRERKFLCVLGASLIYIPIPPALVASRRLVLACVCVLALAALAPSAALADTMSLGLSTEAVQNATTQVTYNVDTEGSGYVSLALNNGDVPCGSSPEDDSGTTILEPQVTTATQTGAFMGSTNFEPIEPGDFYICGWVTGYGDENDLDGTVFATASLPVEVRTPHISLALGLANPVTAGKQVTLNLTVTSEVPREVIVAGVAYTPAGCPVDSGATTALHLIDSVFEGGPSLKPVTMDALPAGSRWIFCAWAVVPGTVTPQASTSLIVDVPSSPPAPQSGSQPKSQAKPQGKSKGHKKSKAGRARGCGTEQLADRYTATIRASGISCRRAHGVVHAVEHAPWPNGVAVPPYFTYSRPFGESTPAGRFTCRFEPFGLAGTEHNIHCKQKQTSVSWYTWQD